jgi:hypothetical protein
MPFLESVTSTEEAEGRKYIDWQGKIYFAADDETDFHHAELVRKAAQDLGKGIRDIDRDPITSKPMVEAAGTISITNGKFDFSVSTGTCKIIYSATEALKKVKARAREIVGAENVN